MIVLLEKKYSKNLLKNFLRKEKRNLHNSVTSAKGWINFAKNGELTPEQVRVMASTGTIAVKNNKPIFVQDSFGGVKRVKAGESPEVVEYVKRLRDLARNGQGV